MPKYLPYSAVTQQNVSNLNVKWADLMDSANYIMHSTWIGGTNCKSVQSFKKLIS
jgi:hypothetical protein